MRLFDTHCHLQDERLRDGLDRVMDRARQAGVTGFVCCGVTEEDWPEVRRIAGRYDGVVPAYGLHPWYLGKRSGGWRDELRACLESDPRAAVGEIGLDHAIDSDTFAGQEEVFRAQMAVAAELGRPVSIHCRKAWAALLEVLDELPELPPGVVVHSFSGSRELVEQLADKGVHFSFSGSITLSGNKRAHRTVPHVPAERLLIETDAPDIPPVIDGRRDYEHPNEPSLLVHILDRVAELRGAGREEIAGLTTRNAERLFGHA